MAALWLEKLKDIFMFTAIKREAKFVSGLLRMLKAVKTIDADGDHLMADELEMRIDRFGSNLAFIEDDKELTYNDVETYANRVAAWALANGSSAGDTVAVFVRNRAEYVALWLGLTKVGIIPALLNFQLTGDALAHCINISGASVVIIDHELTEQYGAAKDDLQNDVKAFCAFGEVSGYESFDAAISHHVPDRPAKSARAGIKASDQFMKMFTSGTTGLPKAAKVTHVRGQNYLRGMAAGCKGGPKDRMMMVLPMYHATGGLVGVGCAISNGGAVIVRPRFSATKFWDEAVEYKATMFTYVGELCRFLLSSPAHPLEREHGIKWMVGNGLRPDVWEGFVGRFNVDHVIEFYGSTEGNAILVNVDGPVGAVGRVPDYLKFKFNLDIIKYDVDTDINPRGSDGFCIHADINESGELIAEIRTDDPRFRFEGYETKAATQKKILRNVFKKDDAWFRTGDLLKRDKLGYYYFMDRVGDTYRWRAENVATGEVAGALSKFKGITQANVYGVQVPGYDGRAGMAAIISEQAPDLAALKEHIEENLPLYARPVFLRLSQEAETTSTFKFKKTNLVKAGYNPANISEPIYFANAASGAYEPVDADVFALINSGEIRL